MLKYVALAGALVLGGFAAQADVSGTITMRINGRMEVFPLVEGIPGNGSSWRGEPGFGNFSALGKHPDGTTIQLGASFSDAGISSLYIFIDEPGQPVWRSVTDDRFAAPGLRLQMEGGALRVDGDFAGTVEGASGLGEVEGSVHAVLPHLD